MVFPAMAPDDEMLFVTAKAFDQVPVSFHCAIVVLTSSGLRRTNHTETHA